MPLHNQNQIQLYQQGVGAGQVIGILRGRSLHISSSSNLPRVGNDCSTSSAHHSFLRSTAARQTNASHRGLCSAPISRQPLKSNDSLFTYQTDEFSGLVIDSHSLPPDPKKFSQMLEASLETWRASGFRGVWLKIPKDKSTLVPAAIDLGFDFHDAEPSQVVMNLWLPQDSPSTLPTSAHTTIGVGGFVLNEKREVLTVAEKYGPLSTHSPKGTLRYKLPTGLVDSGENLEEAVLREVREETGIESKFQTVLAIRHLRNSSFGTGNMYFLCALQATGSQVIRYCERELLDAKWMPINEFIDGADLHQRPESRALNQLCLEYVQATYPGLDARKWTSMPSRGVCVYTAASFAK